MLSATAAPGDLVAVVGGRNRRLGDALWSSRSQIALRMMSVGDEAPGESMWRHRLAAALAFRDMLHIDATAYRVVHGEADRLPSLVVDKYGDYLVVQALSQGTDRRLPELTQALVELMAPKGILARNDPKVRTLEGLEQTVQVLHGDVPSVVQVREGGVEYGVDLRHGQKTGLFLDQRENRVAAGALRAWPDARLRSAITARLRCRSRTRCSDVSGDRCVRGCGRADHAERRR